MYDERGCVLTIFRNTIMLSQTKPMLHVACDASSQATVLCSPPPRMDTRIKISSYEHHTNHHLAYTLSPSLSAQISDAKEDAAALPTQQRARPRPDSPSAAAAAARHTLPNRSDHRCCCCCCYCCCCSPLCLLRGSPLCAGDHRLARGRKREVLVTLRLQLLRQTVGERLSGGGGGGG